MQIPETALEDSGKTQNISNNAAHTMTQIVGATHPGNRDHNEDAFIADSGLGLGLVADGMGGYACGEVASELVRDTVAEAISNNEGLREAIARAHAVVREVAHTDLAKKGMGSTVIAFRMRDQDYELAWVGDSRAYLWDADASTLHQITRDHSYVETLLSSGAISHEEAVNHPNRNLITQAVGVAGDEGLEIDMIRGRLGAHQQLLICSDGLVDEVLDDDIAGLMASAADPGEAVQRLIQQAVANGGSDNISVVIAYCEQGGEAALEPEIVRSTRAARPSVLNQASPDSLAHAGSREETFSRLPLFQKLQSRDTQLRILWAGALLVAVLIVALVL